MFLLLISRFSMSSAYNGIKCSPRSSVKSYVDKLVTLRVCQITSRGKVYNNVCLIVIQIYSEYTLSESNNKYKAIL